MNGHISGALPCYIGEKVPKALLVTSTIDIGENTVRRNIKSLNLVITYI